MTQTDPRFAFWLSTPHFAACEIAHRLGYGKLVLDIEHGAFGTVGLDRVVAYAKAIGLEVYGKVLGPEPVPLMQALDFGCDGVIIPHIEGVEHARAVTAWTKYPPLGKRSYAGGRTVFYDVPTDDFFDKEDRRTKCIPMIEDAKALADVAAIAALPTVDGLFVGPSDLSLTRGRGRYRQTPADTADLEAIAKAAKAAGKPWIMPAWSARERGEARRLGAAWMLIVDETGGLYTGFETALDAARKDAGAA